MNENLTTNRIPEAASGAQLPDDRINLFPAAAESQANGSDTCAKTRETNAVELPTQETYSRAPRLKHLTEGARRLPVVLRCRELLRGGRTWRQIYDLLNVSSTVVKWCSPVEHIPNDGAHEHLITAELLAPQTFKLGSTQKNPLTADERRSVTALVLQTNRTATAGSTPEALRVAMERGQLRPELADIIKAKFAAGVAPLTPAQAASVRVSPLDIRSFRSPRNAWLENVSSPGSLHLEHTAHGEREIQPGEKWTIDDGTINFVCCVPIVLQGNKCSENFGVMVGRFQFLLLVDHRSYFIPGFNYTARPKSSYRAEDLTATMHVAFVEHGCPKKMVLEHGVSAANLVTDTLGLLGVGIERASSPHQKVVEGVFNKLWTKLSTMPGQVGRFRGEEEEVNALIESCRRGATDPRKHFASLTEVVAALRKVIAEHNSQRVNSRQYGSWIPQEFFTRLAPKHLRKLNPADAWMFSPVITRPLTVRGFNVRTTVPLMPGYSETFDFSADWLHEHAGAQVKLYFNPLAPECAATVVGTDGAILGVAQQINRIARFRRRALGYGQDPDIGLTQTKQNAQALRRSSVAIKPDGTAGVQTHEARAGDGTGAVVSRGTDTLATAEMPEPKAVRRSGFEPLTEDQQAKQRKLNSRKAQLARRLSELQTA